MWKRATIAWELSNIARGELFPPKLLLLPSQAPSSFKLFLMLHTFHLLLVHNFIEEWLSVELIIGHHSIHRAQGWGMTYWLPWFLPPLFILPSISIVFCLFLLCFSVFWLQVTGVWIVGEEGLHWFQLEFSSFLH